MNNSKYINKFSLKEMTWVSFRDVIRAVTADARTSDESYNVPFREARLIDIRRDMASKTFIPGDHDSTCSRYINVARLYQLFTQKHDYIVDVNW